MWGIKTWTYSTMDIFDPSDCMDVFSARPSFYHQKNSRKLGLAQLVGGFNPSEKNISQNGNLPQVGVKINNI